MRVSRPASVRAGWIDRYKVINDVCVIIVEKDEFVELEDKTPFPVSETDDDVLLAKVTRRAIAVAAKG